jgi:hypothetical protein
MYFSWAWERTENLIGILIIEDITLKVGEESFSCDLFSIGIILCRIDIVYNKIKQNND